jgi:hypothetical protein
MNITPRLPRRPNASIEMRLLSFPLCHAKAEAAQLVIIDELDSGLFERCLDPNHCRNIASHCLVTFYSRRYGLRDTARVAVDGRNGWSYYIIS